MESMGDEERLEKIVLVVVVRAVRAGVTVMGG